MRIKKNKTITDNNFLQKPQLIIQIYCVNSLIDYSRYITSKSKGENNYILADVPGLPIQGLWTDLETECKTSWNPYHVCHDFKYQDASFST